MTATCATCGQAIVVLHTCEPSDDMLIAAIEAYMQAGRIEDARDFEGAMREAITAALIEAAR